MRDPTGRCFRKMRSVDAVAHGQYGIVGHDDAQAAGSRNSHDRCGERLAPIAVARAHNDKAFFRQSSCCRDGMKQTLVVRHQYEARQIARVAGNFP